jgi:hypothetical protein
MFSNTLDKKTEGKLYNYILQTIPLHHRHNTKGIEINDTQITLEWFNKDDKKDDKKDSKQKGIKIIAMELMDGYITLNEYLHKNKENKDKKIKALCKCMWQFVNLSSIIGVSHHDCHFGNIMINENNLYFDDIDIGQPIIIDFGRANLNKDLTIKEDTKSIETMISITKIEQYISELNKHKYYDFEGRVEFLKFARDNEKITLLDYWNYELNNRNYSLNKSYNINDIFNIENLNNLTKMRVNMTTQFNSALSEEYKTNFNEIIKDFIHKAQQNEKKRKRSASNENNETSKSLDMEGMTAKEVFMNNNNNNNKNLELLQPLEPNYNGINGGGGNNGFRYKNIYKDVFKYIPIEEFKKLIEKEITIRPIEKIFREYKNSTSSKRMKTNKHQTQTLPYNQLVVAYGGTYKYKYKYKYKNNNYKSKKTKKNSYKSKRTKKYNKKLIKNKSR